jgi:hypothetical protein
MFALQTQTFSLEFLFGFYNEIKKHLLDPRSFQRHRAVVDLGSNMMAVSSCNIFCGLILYMASACVLLYLFEKTINKGAGHLTLKMSGTLRCLAPYGVSSFCKEWIRLRINKSDRLLESR